MTEAQVWRDRASHWRELSNSHWDALWIKSFLVLADEADRLAVDLENERPVNQLAIPGA
jgi:hypothetical protein